jgi:hypothetical protein
MALSKYEAFVAAAGAQARTALPGVDLLAGMVTGRSVPPYRRAHERRR